MNNEIKVGSIIRILEPNALGFIYHLKERTNALLKVIEDKDNKVTAVFFYPEKTQFYTKLYVTKDKILEGIDVELLLS